MDDEAKQYKELIDTFIKRSDRVNDKIASWAEKYGQFTESINTKLGKITEKIDKPFWQKLDFYKLLVDALILILLIIFLIIILQQGGCVFVKGWVNIGKCA